VTAKTLQRPGRVTRGSVVALLALVLSGCGSGGAGADVAPPQGVDSTPVAFELYTHCGIHELSFDGGWYERTGGALDDGSGNPPAGWDNPYQAGTLTRSGTTVVFTDRFGHRETFVLREGASAPKTVCS
jgi:hypothetical protein